MGEVFMNAQLAPRGVLLIRAWVISLGRLVGGRGGGINRGFLYGCLLVALTIGPCHGELFDDIAVNGEAMFSAETHHGYVEQRFLVENLSPSETRRVALQLPRSTMPMGNSIGEISRTVTVGPGTKVSVSLWQPPLPIRGHGAGVSVDGSAWEMLSYHGSGRHCVSLSHHSYRSGATAQNILVSRSLDSDRLKHLLQSLGDHPFSASMATGPPDSVPDPSGARVPTAWGPGRSISGTEWIELTYATAMPVDAMNVFHGRHIIKVNEILLKDEQGNEIRRIPSPSPVVPAGSSRGDQHSFKVKLTDHPVKHVRITLETKSAYYFNQIDAVAIGGPDGHAWAESAVASSSYDPSAGRHGTVDFANIIRAESDVSSWSESWLGFSAFDAVVVEESDFQSMPAETKEALWRYAEAGGTLACVGSLEVPPGWRKERSDQDFLVEVYNPGFGQAVSFTAGKLEELGSTQMELLRDFSRTSQRPWLMRSDEATANRIFPIIDDMNIPVRGIVLIMLGFIVVIGPVNLFVLNRLKKRTWMLTTIPLISLITCVIVFVYSFLTEGITPRYRTESVTYLNQTARRATTLGMAAVYAPLTPSGGLMFDRETEVTPLVAAGHWRSGTSREVELSEGQELRRGWVSARVPAHFQLRKSESRRERLEIERNPAGGMRVVNGLGAKIESLLVADEEGSLYSGKEIAAGAQVDLQRETSQRARGSGIGTLYSEGKWAELVPRISDAPESYLEPGAYIAQFGEPVFLEVGLRQKMDLRARTVVYGVYAANELTREPEPGGEE